MISHTREEFDAFCMKHMGRLYQFGDAIPKIEGEPDWGSWLLSSHGLKERYGTK